MIWILISVLVVVIDQASKYAVVQNIEEGQMIPVIDNFFYLTLHRNPGAAWGILQNARWFFLIMVPVVTLIVLYMMIKNKSTFLRLILAIILGGAVGNYIDRVAVGKVTDFLLFYIGSYDFPIFNAADIFLTCGTALLAVYILFFYREPVKKETADTNSGAADMKDQGTDDPQGKGTDE